MTSLWLFGFYFFSAAVVKAISVNPLRRADAEWALHRVAWRCAFLCAGAALALGGVCFVLALH